MARQMKDCGVEWIGEIPEEWQVIKCKHLTTVQAGFPFDSAKFSNSEGTPLIRIRDITSGNAQTYYTGEYDSGYIVSKGDLLIGMDGDFNIRIWQGENALLNQRCCRVISNAEIELGFLYYCLPFHLDITNNLAYATTVKHLSNSDIRNAPIPYPKKNKRVSIITHLDTKCGEIDKVVEQTRATIEEYKKLKQAIITEAVTKGVRGPRPMKPSGVEWIGDIPVEWEFTRVKHVIKNYKAGPFGSALITANLLPKGDILVYTPEHIAKHTAELEGNLYLPNERQEEMSAFIVNEGDIIFPIVGSLGRAMLISSDMPKGIINQRLAKFCLVSDKIRSDFFLWLFAKSSFYSVYIDVNCRGAIIVNLTKEIIKAMPLTLPSMEEQQEIATYLDTKCAEIDRIIEKKEQLIEELGSYKKSLIYEYVTGKKEVKTNMELKVPYSN